MGRKSNYDKLVSSISKALSRHPEIIRFHEDLRADVQEVQPPATEETLEIDLGDDNDEIESDLPEEAGSQYWEERRNIERDWPILY